jgi:aryl-alcohol dehydrogenase-like predicted oxidoreductase
MVHTYRTCLATAKDKAMTSERLGGVFNIGGDMPVRRMGYGAMQLTGPGIWGPPDDPENAKAVLRRAVDLGVTFIDTADVYGPRHNEREIRAALRPYPDDLVIGTKCGLVRSGPATPENPGMSMNGAEPHIRAAVEGSLTALGVERLDLCQLHRVDPAVPIEDTMGVFRALRDEGKIRHIGLSQVTVAEIERARAVVEIATVQNIYNLAVRNFSDVVAYCAAEGIAFLPFWPLHIQGVADSEGLARVAEETGATRRQVALAWLLKTSPTTILIPGTSSLTHLVENVAAADVDLSADHMSTLDALGGTLVG